jgi:hypothetical protein
MSTFRDPITRALFIYIVLIVGFCLGLGLFVGWLIT